LYTVGVSDGSQDAPSGLPARKVPRERREIVAAGRAGFLLQLEGLKPRGHELMIHMLRMLGLVLLCLFFNTAPVAAMTCTTHTYYVDGRYVMCQTCCTNGMCNTTCM
jgi:hypothetical protein